MIHRFFLYFLLSLAWSWPLVLSPASATVSLHFDQFPAAWLVHAAPTFVPDGVSELSGWPNGEPLARLDSFLFLGLSVLLGGALPGLLVTNLFVLLGPPISAMAADRFAREALGVRGAASMVAGIAFGFAPLATVAALEGHVYMLLDPWLPLFALAVWQRRRVAVLWFALCLLTTAYFGIDALVVLAGVGLARGLDRRTVYGVGAVGVAYAAAFLAGGGAHSPGVRGEDALLRVGSASLTTLVAWTPWMDLNRHSLAPAVGILPLVFALRAPRVVGRGAFLLVGLACMALALGPAIEAGVDRSAWVPGPLWPLLRLGVFDVFRFPVRLCWVGALFFGALAAVTAARRPKTAVALAAIDALVFSGAVVRLRAHPTPVPSAYALLPDGPVLDLYPEIGGAQEDMPFYEQNLSCYYQLFHDHPVLDRCLNTDIRANPRVAAAREVHARALAGEPVLPALKELGVASVVVHADLYQPFERAQIVAALSAELAPAAEGHDGGEWLVAFRVPG